MMRRGCSSTGSDRTSAATSSAVFHLASWLRRFCPAHTLVWMIFRKSCPLRGLKMKIAPLMGLVVRLPSKVLWMVTLGGLAVGRGRAAVWGEGGLGWEGGVGGGGRGGREVFGREGL